MCVCVCLCVVCGVAGFPPALPSSGGASPPSGGHQRRRTPASKANVFDVAVTFCDRVAVLHCVACLLDSHTMSPSISDFYQAAPAAGICFQFLAGEANEAEGAEKAEEAEELEAEKAEPAG